MSKDNCLIAAPALPAEGLLRKVTRMIIGTTATKPAQSQTRRRPGPVLHRLPDLREFGPKFR